MNSSELSKKIEEATLSAIENGTIDRKTLRQIVIGPSRLGDTILLWSFDNWSNYPYTDEEDAYAKISNSEWLDRWDALDDPTGEQADRLRPELRATIHEAIREILSDQSLGEFSNLVGFAECRLNAHADIEHGTPANIDDDSEGEVFAFYHPQGGGQIIGIMEHIPPSHLIYPFGSLLENGIALFYPEGLPDSLSGKDQSPGVRILSFDDLEAWWMDDGRESVVYRIKNQPLSLGLSSGHTHEEWGQPNSQEIDRMLAEHFEIHVPHLKFISETQPNIVNLDEIKDWQNRFVKYGIYPDQLFKKLIVTFEFEDVLRFADSFPDEKIRLRALTGLASRLRWEDRHREALETLSRLSAAERLEEWRIEIHSLISLGSAEETLTLLSKLKEAIQSPRKKGHPLADKDDIAIWEILAFLISNRKEDAVKSLEQIQNKDEKYDFARAVILQESDPKEAQTSLLKALERDILNLHLEHLITESNLKKLVHMAVKTEKMLEQAQLRSDKPILQLEKRAETKRLSWTQRELRSETTRQWRVLSEIDFENKIDPNNVNVVFKKDSHVWIACSSGLMRLETNESNEIVMTRFGENSLNCLTFQNHFIYASCSEGIRIFEMTDGKSPISKGLLPHFKRSAPSSVISNEETLAVLSDQVCILYSLKNPETPRLISKITVDSQLYGYPEGIAIRGNYLFLSTKEQRIITFDISDPQQPRCITSIHLPWKEDGGGRLWIFEDLLVLEINEGVWLVDVSDPAEPKSIASFVLKRFKSPVRNKNKLFLISERLLIFEFNLDTLKFEQASHTILRDGNVNEDYSDRNGIFLNDRLLLISPEKLELLEYSHIPSFPDPSSYFMETESVLKKKIQSKLSEIPEDFKLGILTIQRYRCTFRIFLDKPSSFVGANTYKKDQLDTEIDLNELDDHPLLKAYLEETTPEEIKDPDSNSLFRLRCEVVLNELTKKILTWLPSCGEFLRIASGRVYLCHRINERLELVNTFLDDTKEWKPFRSEID